MSGDEVDGGGCVGVRSWEGGGQSRVGGLLWDGFVWSASHCLRSIILT